MAGLSVASLFVGVSANTSQAESQLNSFQGTMRSVANQLESTGAGITTAIGAPLAAVGGTVGKLGIDFESALSRVRKTTGLTAADTAALGKGILDLSASTEGGARSADDLAKIAEIAGQLGIEGSDNILRFTRIISQFSGATGIAGDQAAAQLQAIQLLTGVDPGQLENVSSTIVDLGNKTAATESQINEFALRLAGSLHTAGATAQEILGISATLASLQIDPEAGGTAISKFFVDMSAAANSSGAAVKDTSAKTRELQEHLQDLSTSLNTAQLAQTRFGRNTPAAEFAANAAAIDRYKREIVDTQADMARLNSTQENAAGSAAAMAKVAGITTDEFRALVKTNPTAAFQKIIAGIGNIRETQGAGAAFTAISSLGVDDARQRDAILRLSAGSADLTKNIDEANAAFSDNTAAAQENAIQMESTQAQWDILTNQVKKQIIEAWDILKPAVLNAMNVFRDTVLPRIEQARLAFAGLPEPVRNFAIALGAILVVVGPALVLFGLLAGALAAISLPVLLIAAAVAVLAAAWVTNFGDIQGKTEAVMGVIAEKFQSVKDLWDNNSAGIISAFQNIATAVATIFGRINSIITTAFVFMLTLADRVLREVGQFFTDHLQGPIQAVGQWIGDNILGPLVELLRFLQQIIATTGLGGALGGLDLNDAIRSGEIALQNLSGGIAAGGPGTANNIVVNLNNPSVPDQTAAERLAAEVKQQVLDAMVAAESASAPPAGPNNAPVVPFVPGTAF